MTDSPNTPGSYAAVLRERWALVAITTVVCLVLALVFLQLSSKRYTASADLQTTPVASGDADFVGIPVFNDSAITPSANVLTIVRIVDQPATAAVAKQQLRSPLSIEQLQSGVVASPVSQTSMVSISATEATPADAVAVANAFASATIARRNQAFQRALVPVVTRLRSQAKSLAGGKGTSAESAAVQARLAVLQPLVGGGDPTVSILESATPPAGPSSPHTSLTLLAALFGGLFLGIVFALARGLMPNRLHRDDDVEHATGGIPVLARIPASASHAAFAFRHLGARIRPQDQAAAAILVMSAARGDGSSQVAAGIAQALGRSGSRVLLLDCDIADSALVTELGIARGARPRFVTHGLGGRPTVRVDERVAFMQTAPPRAGELERLSAATVRDMLDELKAKADVIVIDGGSASSSLGVAVLAEAADATVLTVRRDRTSRQAVEQLSSLLAEIDAPPMGVVVLDASGRPARRAFPRLPFDRSKRGAATTKTGTHADTGERNGRSSEAARALVRTIGTRRWTNLARLSRKSSAAARTAGRGAES